MTIFQLEMVENLMEDAKLIQGSHFNKIKG